MRIASYRTSTEPPGAERRLGRPARDLYAMMHASHNWMFVPIRQQPIKLKHTMAVGSTAVHRFELLSLERLVQVNILVEELRDNPLFLNTAD